MLYDIVSPLIFFSSLGGILILVSRVVVRVRKQNFAHEVKAVGHSSSVVADQKFDAAGLFKPTQKGVQVMKSRIAVAGHSVRDSGSKLKAMVANRRERQAEKAQAEHEVAPAPPTPAAATTESAEAAPAGIQMPESRFGRWQRFRRPRAASATTAESAPAAPAAPVAEPATTATSTQGFMVGSAIRQATSRLQQLRQRRKAEADPTTDETTGEEAIEEEVAAPKLTRVTRRATDRPATAAEVSGLRARLRNRRSEPNTPRPAPTVIGQAQEAIAASDYEHAEELLIPYIVKHAKDTAAYLLLGQTALGKEDWTEAIEIYEQVLKWEDSTVEAYNGLGYAAYQNGQYTKALRALQRAHDANPTDKKVLEYLLSIARKLDNPALEHSFLEELAELQAQEKKSQPPKKKAAVRAAQKTTKAKARSRATS